MKYQHGLWVVAAIACLVALPVLVPGCKKDPSTDAGQSYFDQYPVETLPREDSLPPALVMTPATYEATMAGGEQIFSVTGGEEPIEWRVSNKQSGYIEVQPNTRNAIYVALQPKSNTVIARDGAGNAALAQITGEDSATLTVLPSTHNTLEANGDQIDLYVRGGTRWYSWEVVFEQKGQIVSQLTDGSEIRYQRTTDGEQVLIATDSDGRYVQVTISQPLPTPLAASASPSSLTTNGTFAVLHATGGKPPYTWYVGTAAGSLPFGSTGESVAYRRDAAGDNIVTVKDGATPQAIATVTIKQ